MIPTENRNFLYTQNDNNKTQPRFTALTCYRVTAIPYTSFTLPTHSGSMLRGAFGKALRAQQCCCGAGSTHQPTCLYAIVFEGLGGKHIAGCEPPPRFVIQRVMQHNCSANNAFEFTVTLLGLSKEQQQFAMAAWPYALKSGLGSMKVPCRVMEISRLPALSTQTINTNSITLELTSPWQIKRSGKALSPEQCTGNDILFAINHRLALLNSHFRLDLPHLSAQSLTQYCEAITSNSQLRRSNWQRYSSRQGKSHPLVGLTGKIQLHAEKTLAPLSHMLQVGQHVNAGGKTAFGLGAYRVMTNNDI